MCEWIKHDGSGIPVEDNTLVAVRFKDGWTDKHHETHETAVYWWEADEEEDCWTWKDCNDDHELISEYMVVQK